MDTESFEFVLSPSLAIDYCSMKATQLTCQRISENSNLYNSVILLVMFSSPFSTFESD